MANILWIGKNMNVRLGEVTWDRTFAVNGSDFVVIVCTVGWLDDDHTHDQSNQPHTHAMPFIAQGPPGYSLGALDNWLLSGGNEADAADSSAPAADTPVPAANGTAPANATSTAAAKPTKLHPAKPKPTKTAASTTDSKAAPTATVTATPKPTKLANSAGARRWA